MGYFKIESFDKLEDWNLSTDPGEFIRFTTTDFEHLQVNAEKTSTLVAYFDSSKTYIDVAMSKTLSEKRFFKFPDVYKKPIYYDTLRVSYRAEVDRNFDTYYKHPNSFFLSFGIMENDVILREWFVPVIPVGCSYTHVDFDLKPLFDEAKATQGFDTMFFRVLRHPLNSRIYFGEAYLVQESDPTHNIKLALADLLHLRKKEHLTTLGKAARAGDIEIEISDTADVQKGTGILFQNVTTGEEEMHVISAVDFTLTGGRKRAKISFINEFDGDKLLFNWANGTKIYRVFPAIIEELKDSESIFPVYFIYNEAMTNDEENGHILPVVDNYVRNAESGHTSAIHQGLNAVVMNASINIFSNVPEVAQEMWDFLKGFINTQSILDVAGKPYQYLVSSERDVSPEEAEVLPHYVMELTFYFQHNQFERRYRPFPVFSDVKASFDLIPVEVIV